MLWAIDGWNLVGPWVIGVGESESGVKGQKNIEFSEIVSKVYEDLNMVGP